jgi:hypothetical protein
VYARNVIIIVCAVSSDCARYRLRTRTRFRRKANRTYTRETSRFIIILFEIDDGPLSRRRNATTFKFRRIGTKLQPRDHARAIRDQSFPGPNF